MLEGPASTTLSLALCDQERTPRRMGLGGAAKGATDARRLGVPYATKSGGGPGARTFGVDGERRPRHY